MNCQFCNKEFNLEENLPLKLSCDHLLCKECAEYMKLNFLSVLCSTCQSKAQGDAKNPLVIEDNLKNEDFPIEESMISLIKDKASYKCCVHNTLASQLEPSTLKLYCENHKLIEKDRIKGFKAMKKHIFVELFEYLLDKKQKINPPIEEMKADYSKFCLNLSKLKENHQEIKTKLETIENFRREKMKEFEIYHHMEYFKQTQMNAKSMSVEDKVKFLKTRKNCEDVDASIFKTKLIETKDELKSLDEKLQRADNKSK